jgi:hypothetical protein
MFSTTTMPIGTIRSADSIPIMESLSTMVVSVVLSTQSALIALVAQTSGRGRAISQLVLFGITIVAIVAAAIFTVVLTKRQD